MSFRKHVLIPAAGLLLAAGFATSAAGFDVGRARTRAAIQTSAAGDHTIQLEFAAELIHGLPDLVSQDLEVGWGPVGGVQPQPFRVLIPAGCFVSRSRGFRVRDFSACGVEILVPAAAGELDSLDIQDFDARVVARDDATYRLDVLAQFHPPDPVHPPDPIYAILDVLGGGGGRVAIGSESSMVFPVSTETLSGISPEPF